MLKIGSPLLKSIVRYSVPLKEASEGALSVTKQSARINEKYYTEKNDEYKVQNKRT